MASRGKSHVMREMKRSAAVAEMAILRAARYTVKTSAFASKSDLR